MGIGKRIKEARERKGFTQKELGKIIGVTGSAITNYENGTSHPKEPVMYALIDALGVDANFLFQDCVKIKEAPLYSSEAMRLARDYDSLDIHGKRMIRLVADEEMARCTAKSPAPPRGSGLELTVEQEADEFAAKAREQFLSEKRQASQTSSAKEFGSA